MPRPAKLNLSGMDVPALMALRTQVDDALAERRKELEQQLKALGKAVDGAARDGRRGSSPLAGRSVPPKYRLGNQTWAGRGQLPKFLVEAMKEQGKKLDDFLIAKEQGARKKRRAKK